MESNRLMDEPGCTVKRKRDVTIARVVLGVLVFLTVGVSFLVLVTMFLAKGPGGAIAPGVRFVLTCVLCGFVLVGKSWARWTLVVLNALAILIWFWLAFQFFAGGGQIGAFLMMSIMPLLSAAWIVTLCVESPVARYFAKAPDS